MSIQTEINRLNNAKANILSSIQNKGVDTSSVETLDDVSVLIDSISASEDLDTELTQQSNLLSTQGMTIDDIKEALKGKGTGGGGAVEPDYKTLYQKVEYITSAEEETYPYIITDTYADNNTGLEIVASFPVMQDRIPMGSREDSGNTRFYCVYPLSTSSVYYGFNSGASISCSTTVNTIYRLQTNFLNSRLVCVYEKNGTRKVNNSINATLTPHTVPISIFGYNSASSGVVSSKREYKLYSARISKGHEVIRDYVPCYRKSDGVVGLYEKVTGQFLINEGGGAFAKGVDVEW